MTYLLIHGTIADALTGGGTVLSRHRSPGRAARAAGRLDVATALERCIVVELADGSRQVDAPGRPVVSRGAPAADGPRASRINVPMSAAEVEAVERASDRVGTTVSEYVRAAVRDELARDQRRNKLGLAKTKGAP